MRLQVVRAPSFTYEVLDARGNILCRSTDCKCVTAAAYLNVFVARCAALGCMANALHICSCCCRPAAAPSAVASSCNVCASSDGQHQ
jgi:hypothetical protein